MCGVALGLVTADLAVAVARRRALLEVHALENGVFAELFLDGEGGLLELSLARKRFLLLPALFLLGGVVGEQVELLTVVPARRSVPERKRFLVDCGPRRSAPRKTVRNIG